MPLTAIGRYDICVMKRGEAAYVFRQTLTYIPFFRIVVLLILLGAGAIALLNKCGLLKWHPALWLLVPAAVAAFVGAAAPSPYGSISGSPAYVKIMSFLVSFLPMAKEQLICLALVLPITLVFRRRSRVLCFLAGWGMNDLVAISSVFAMSAISRPEWILFALGASLTRHIGTVFGLIAVRKKFSQWRLALGMAMAWLPMVAVKIGVFCSLYGIRWLGSFAQVAFLDDILYVVGFWLFVAFSPWWRERVFRAYGVMGGREDCRMPIAE